MSLFQLKMTCPQSDTLAMNSRGFSMLSVLVLLSISATLFGMIYKSFQYKSKYSTYAASLGLLEDLRAYVKANRNCAATFPGPTPPPACGTTAGGPIAVSSNTTSNPILIPIPSGNTFKRFGPFALRGWCKDDGFGNPQFTIQVNRLSPDGSKAIGDPLKNLLMDGTPASTYSPNAYGWTDLLPGALTCVL